MATTRRKAAARGNRGAATLSSEKRNRMRTASFAFPKEAKSR